MFVTDSLEYLISIFIGNFNLGSRQFFCSGYVLFGNDNRARLIVGGFPGPLLQNRKQSQ